MMERLAEKFLSFAYYIMNKQYKMEQKIYFAI